MNLLALLAKVKERESDRERENQRKEEIKRTS